MSVSMCPEMNYNLLLLLHENDADTLKSMPLFSIDNEALRVAVADVLNSCGWHHPNYKLALFGSILVLLCRFPLTKVCRGIIDYNQSINQVNMINISSFDL